jgi:cell division septum initiation protein DivIVA
MAEVVLETLPRLLLAAENERLRARIAELEDWLAERRDFRDRLAGLAPAAAEPSIEENRT